MRLFSYLGHCLYNIFMHPFPSEREDTPVVPRDVKPYGTMKEEFRNAFIVDKDEDKE